VDRYQSEDVFEHVDLGFLAGMLNEIHRILKPGAMFRLSLPDYNHGDNRGRTLKGPDGELRFDPGGGGRYEDNKVVGGGHVWFPTIDIVRQLIEASAFRGRATYLQYNQENGKFVADPIDYSLGYVQRTPDNDPRAINNRRPLSIVVDAVKR
jgi:hypothetical protein